MGSRYGELDNRAVLQMAHDLRAPLNGILGFVKVLLGGEGGPLGEEQREYLGYVLESAQRLEALLEDVEEWAGARDWSKAMDGVSAGDVLRDAVARAAAGAGRGLRFEGHVDQALSVPSDWSPATGRLRRVADLMLAAAVRFTRDGGTVRLRTVPVDAASVRIEVEDGGEPLPEGEAGDVFRPFHCRLHAQARGYQGSGLELAQAARIAERSGGTAEATPLADGNRIAITLPLR